MSTPDFYAQEIRRALEEQNFGIKSFAILETDTLQAKASVILLEGQTIIIKLDSKGYSIELNEGTLSNTEENMIHDYLDSLLQSVSREYESQRHQIWVEKLEGLLS